MDFKLTDEQQMLAEGMGRYLSERHGFDARRRIVAGDEGFSRAQWREFADLGWLAAGLPEAAGGLGGSAIDHMVVAQAMGQALWSGPWLDTVVMGAPLLAESAATAPHADLLEAVIGGRSLLACAFLEPQGRHVLEDVTTTAERDGSGWRLHGRKAMVRFASVADHLLVSARVHGSRRERAGIGVFLVPAGADGLRRQDHRAIDGQPVSELFLHDVEVDAAYAPGSPEAGLSLLERACDRGAAALVAEAAGAMWFLHQSTLGYLQTRQQFGVALSSFQALQHRMVDVYTACEMARSMAWVAALGADQDDARARARAVSAAKCRTGEAAVRVAQECVQLQGGMGMTDDMPTGHYFKRITAINATLGDVAFHARRFQALAAAGVNTG